MASLKNIILSPLFFAAISFSSPLGALPSSDPPHVEITLQNIQYSSHTRFWGPSSVRTGIATVDFNISNTQAPNIHCTAVTSDGGFQDSYFKYIVPMTYYCDTPSGTSSTPANFTFSRFQNEFTVNQTWSGPAIG